jgi:membrane-associated phospholipid phosphatase
MWWGQSIDTALFRAANQRIANPVMDWMMPFFSGNRFFIPAVVCLAVFLIWRGGARGRVFVPVLLLILALGDTLVVNTIKHAVGRPRPYLALEGTRELVGRGESASMPSSHTSTWFGATFLAAVFYRSSWRFMLPLAGLVGLSRVYVGAHYPSDVVAGALIGVGYAAAGLWLLNMAWSRWGRAWFPEQWEFWPSLFSGPGALPMAGQSGRPRVDAERRWIRLGYVLIAATFIIGLLYLAAGKIELSEDEAYQWIWSKHLALSYFSKPPLIAYAQFLGTSIWGDNAFGVRFLSPVIGAILSLLLLRFISRQANARTAFWLVALLQCAPLLAVGSILLTIDPLLVLFWTLAMMAGWRAVQPDARTRDWLWVGLALGGGLLSKYSAAYEIICFLFFFLAWKPARAQLRRPGPWLALGLALLSTVPVLIWNAQHGWITVKHVSQNAGLDKTWEPTLRYFYDFAGTELFLLNPVLVIGAIWACVAMWKLRPKNQFLVYCFCMGAPVLIGHLLYTFHSRVLPNWIAPAVIPIACLTVIFWEQRWREGVTQIRGWLIAAILIGGVPIIVLHDTNLVTKLTGHPLPAEIDPLRRVRGWSETAAVVGRERESLLAEGKEVFIIGAHYGLVGQISFYLPEARARVTAIPLVYYPSSDHPENQFYFWPGYEGRAGQNAIFVEQEKPGQEMPERLMKQFDSIRDLGIREIQYRGRIFRTLHLYACRNLHSYGKTAD